LAISILGYVDVSSPMLATLAEAPLVDAALVYEPKYDGIRAVADVDAGGRSIHLWSRLGNEKTSQFPEIAAALAAWAKRRREPVVLDGEVVALDSSGNPAGLPEAAGTHSREGRTRRRGSDGIRAVRRSADRHTRPARAAAVREA
jgi:ATP-dependent DNA ligase